MGYQYIADVLTRKLPYLPKNLNNNPKITGSSTFKDRMTAEKVADIVLRDPENIGKIQKWLSDPNSRPTLPLIQR